MIWQSQYLSVENGRLLVYYGGTEGPHRQISDTRAPSKDIGYQEKVVDRGGHFLPFNSALCRASWRFDRLYALASSAGGPTIGTARTKPRPIGGKKLYVNLATRPAMPPDLHPHLPDLSDRLPLAWFLSSTSCRPGSCDHIR
jgi:hypothetical protein